MNIINASRISNELQYIRDKLKDIERRAENAVKESGPFSFGDFENDFIHNNINLFRPRKLKPILPSKSTSEFDYSTFLKNFQSCWKRLRSPVQFLSLIRTLLKKF